MGELKTCKLLAASAVFLECNHLRTEQFTSHVCDPATGKECTFSEKETMPYRSYRYTESKLPGKCNLCLGGPLDVLARLRTSWRSSGMNDDKIFNDMKAFKAQQDIKEGMKSGEARPIHRLRGV